LIVLEGKAKLQRVINIPTEGYVAEHTFKDFDDLLGKTIVVRTLEGYYAKTLFGSHGYHSETLEMHADMLWLLEKESTTQFDY
jgi:hypothetical protein